MSHATPMTPEQRERIQVEYHRWLRTVPTWQLEMWLATTDSEERKAMYRAVLEEREKAAT